MQGVLPGGGFSAFSAGRIFFVYGLYLIAVMIITGGAIAFIGDRIGTKVGKKRLSIFGLRPRHTSIIVTIVTGILITAISIGTLAIISKDVRTALFGMEELNATMYSTKIALAETINELTQAEQEIHRADAELKKAKQEIAALKAEHEELTAESERLKAGNERLEIEKSELTAQNENLSSTNASLENDNKSLASTNANLETDNKKLSEFNVTLTADNEKLSADNEKLVQNNSELEEHAKNLREGLIAIREGDIIFRAGEILSSGVISGARSVEEITEEINKLADAASKNIAERFGTDVDTSVWIYQPEMQRVIDTIHESKQDMILRIIAAGNLIRGEPIRTSLTVYPNNLVYSKDEFVFSQEYEIKSSDDAEKIVGEFLNEINHAAVAKGILPDPITGSVGVMEGSQLYGLIESIEEVRGKILLTAYSRENTKSIGPLRLNIKLQREIDRRT